MNILGYFSIQPPFRLAESVIASVGALMAIAVTSFTNAYFLGDSGALAVLPSMGALAVLLFAVPHGPMSQPWALFVGNAVSAVVGVTAFQCIASLPLAASAAVGGAMAAMFLLRCVHPPGGATALAAVIGGEAINTLGYSYVTYPVLLNCSMMFLMAVLINNCFAWRRYPKAAVRYANSLSLKKGEENNSGLLGRGKRFEQGIGVEAYNEAIRQSHLCLDITGEQIKDLVDLASRQGVSKVCEQESRLFEVGGLYSNAAQGREWSVREIIADSPHENANKHMLMYRVVEGAERFTSDSCSLVEFEQWAKEQLYSVRK